MAILRAANTINGTHGKAFANIDGQIIDLFYIKSIEATATPNKVEVKALGSLATQHKYTGWTGSGTVSMNFLSPTFRDIMAKYVQTGVNTYFTMTVVVSDPESKSGKQTCIIRNCSIDSVSVTKLDRESAILEEDVPFTFEDFEYMSTFNQTDSY